METADLNHQQKIFYSLINALEKEYYLYFGLKTIQKGLERAESIYDHFKFDDETRKIKFCNDSDLPEEIRKMIVEAYQQVFSRLMPRTK